MMKRQTLFLLLCSLGIFSSAHAQSRPLRVQVGGNGFYFGSISLDVKKEPKHSRVFSIYAEELLSMGDNHAAADISPPPPPLPATRFDSLNSIGVSLRQPLRRDLWGGIGIGGYTRHYRDYNSLPRNVTGVGGKVFVGYGRGSVISELSFIAPANLKNSMFQYTVGVRL